MASNARILYNMDTWDAATITGSSQANTDLVPANVVHDHVSKMWRTTGKASENIVFDLGTATNITVFSMFTFNLTASATVTLQANASDSWGSPSYSQALTIATDADGNVLRFGQLRRLSSDRAHGGGTVLRDDSQYKPRF